MGKRVYGVGNASGVSDWYPHIVTVVVIKTGSDLIASIGLDSKRFSALTRSWVRTLIPGVASGVL